MKYYGVAKDEMSPAMRAHCAGIEMSIAIEWKGMTADEEDRDAIKKKIWAMVKAGAESYFNMRATA
ncbi:hypothetical protein CCP3SC15_230012 [Gammaproteobacteria bacterium]